MKKVKKYVVIGIVCAILLSNFSSVKATNSINNEEKLSSNSISAKDKLAEVVVSFTENGLTKDNIQSTIELYKELSIDYSHEEIIGLLENQKNEIKKYVGNTDYIDNIENVLKTFDKKQLNIVLNKVNIDEALNEIGEGTTILDILKKATDNMNTTDKVGLFLELLWSANFIQNIMIIMIVLIICKLFTRCVIYKKAGEHAWAVLIPIYRDAVMLKICGMSRWWLLLLLIPIIGWIILWLVHVASRFMLAEAFEKSEAFGIGLWLIWPVFELLLVFNKKIKYVGIEK